MEYTLFRRNVAKAAEVLSSICQRGYPSEDQMKEATQAVGLCVEDESYITDPVGLVVFLKAYHPILVPIIDKMIYNAWALLEKNRPSATV